MEEKSNAVLRTEKRLRTAYTQLLCEKNYKDINVKALTASADMSRAAFYLHFADLEDFSLYCKKHLIGEISRQLICFLDNRNNLDEVCRRSKLTVSETDRELFCMYRKQEIYFIKDRDFVSVNPYFYDFFRQRFSDKFVEENLQKLDFFIRAYTVTEMELFEDYSRERAKKEMQYTFMLWDRLFPDYKL